MPSDVDRIRRILSDGVAAPTPQAEPRLRQVPGAPKAPDPRLDEDLRQRLEALGVRTATRTPLPERLPLHGTDAVMPPPRHPLHPPAQAFAWDALPQPGSLEDPVPLADFVGAVPRETPHGSFLLAERRFALADDHGRIPLADALEVPIPLRRHERGPCGREVLDLRDAVFIDTETTGLAGGTGTVAFLVGAGWIEDDAFLVRQYFMRDYPDEGALLHALQSDLGDRPLVSFNGRSFDWPLLTTRWRMHRSTPGPRAHLDLLPPSRRLWCSTLHSHSLAVLERHVLGLERGEDLPGYMIPTAWFDYLRTGWGGTIAQAFRHNEIDVVSMVALFARVGAILRDPVGGVDAPGDRLGTARLLLDLGEESQARACLAEGLGGGEEDVRPLRRVLGHLCRRAGDFEEALGHWRAVTESGGFDAEAHEQVAKLYEHRLRDHAAALRWTEDALEHVVEGTRPWEAFAHRAARLRRKLEAAEG